MGDFNSEISGSSCSIPSEPPDIRNWFSSYKYESFVLDTCENFGGFFSDKSESNKDELVIGEINRETEDNFDGSGEITKSDEHGNLNSKEVQDSLDSPSILSEPPNIRNWFSSYVYESPLLDTDDGLNSYVSKEIECEKNELVTEESIKDEVSNSGQLQETNNSCKEDAPDKTCSTKLIKSISYSVDRKNESQPLFTEPPDIGNWFPDYVYGSPVLDTSDEFGGILSMETEPNEDKFTVKDIKRKTQENLKTTTKTICRKELVVGEKICSNEFGKCKSSLRHDEQEGKPISMDLHWARGKENLYWQDNVCSRKSFYPSLEVKQVQSSMNSFGHAKNSDLNGRDSISKHERADSQSLDISGSPSRIDSKSLKKMIDRSGSIAKSSETKLLINQVNLASHDQSLDFNQVNEGYQRKTAHGNHDKENEGKDIAENGFISTKKNKFVRKNDENYVRVQGEILLKCLRTKGCNNTSTGGEKDGVMNRKVLAETTNANVHQSEAKTTMGITGKWHCPSKSKPPRGPPLKQLRLEQWVRRL